jgi:peptidoglycan hydrolase CwlO-like protein
MLALVETWHFRCCLHAVMNDTKLWILVGITVFGLVTFFTWKAFWAPNGRESLVLQEKEEKIRDMEDRVAKLQKELEESAKQIEALQAGSDQTTQAHRSGQRKINVSTREETRLADRIPSPELSFYEAVRSTSVFEEPSASSRKVASISRGSRVRVVGSTSDWLEVRSRQGRPPGFIRRDDAVLSR